MQKLCDDCFRARSQFRTPVYFCWFGGRDLLQAFRPCDPEGTGWRPNFMLYGGTRQTENTITVYDYINNRRSRLSSNLFLRNDINQSHLQLRRDTYYIPGNDFQHSLSINRNSNTTKHIVINFFRYQHFCWSAIGRRTIWLVLE